MRSFVFICKVPTFHVKVLRISIEKLKGFKNRT